MDDNYVDRHEYDNLLEEINGLRSAMEERHEEMGDMSEELAGLRYELRSVAEKLNISEDRENELEKDIELKDEEFKEMASTLVDQRTTLEGDLVNYMGQVIALKNKTWVNNIKDCCVSTMSNPDKRSDIKTSIKTIITNSLSEFEATNFFNTTVILPAISAVVGSESRSRKCIVNNTSSTTIIKHNSVHIRDDHTVEVHDYLLDVSNIFDDVIFTALDSITEDVLPDKKHDDFLDEILLEYIRDNDLLHYTISNLVTMNSLLLTIVLSKISNSSTLGSAIQFIIEDRLVAEHTSVDYPMYSIALDTKAKLLTVVSAFLPFESIIVIMYNLHLYGCKFKDRTVSDLFSTIIDYVEVPNTLDWNFYGSVSLVEDIIKSDILKHMAVGRSYRKEVHMRRLNRFLNVFNIPDQNPDSDPILHSLQKHINFLKLSGMLIIK